MKRLHIALVLSFGFVTACGGEPPITNEIQVGGGADDGSPGFVSLNDGANITLQPGSQGGFHVYINVRMNEGLMGSFDRMVLDRKARRVDTEQLVSKSNTDPMMVPAMEDGLVETAKSIPLFMCPTPVGIAVQDREIELEVTATDVADGAGPRTTLRFVPKCPSGPQKEFCERICNG